MKKYVKFISWFVSILIVVIPTIGCGVFNPPQKDKDGYYIDHFYSCGPKAMELAINEYYKREGIKSSKSSVDRKKISKSIQRDGQALKTLLSFFDKETVCITWSWEMKNAANKYGFELIGVKDFEELDPSKDVALVLVYGKLLSSKWHWMCYPVDRNILNYFGPNTKVDKIYILKKL
tara:strand:+ start:256 stop:786 length:531 start_codon:yes stop_codon:yes gene_type:complete